jgi:hypothetical protein
MLMDYPQAFGRFNWTLAEAFSAKYGGSPFSNGQPVTGVLALHPDIDLARVRNWTELSLIVSGLVQAALLSHRTPLLPDLPCQSAWLHPRGSDRPGIKLEEMCDAPVYAMEGTPNFRWDMGRKEV